MSKENPLWGAPRIHGELLKLGFKIAESTVSKYMIRHRGLPSLTWRTFLRNHANAIAAIDLCGVRTLTFECLFVLAQQMVEAFPWDTASSYLVRDSDGGYGQTFKDRVRAMGRTARSHRGRPGRTPMLNA
jgi:hypothetical protein